MGKLLTNPSAFGALRECNGSCRWPDFLHHLLGNLLQQVVKTKLISQQLQLSHLHQSAATCNCNRLAGFYEKRHFRRKVDTFDTVI